MLTAEEKIAPHLPIIALLLLSNVSCIPVPVIAKTKLECEFPFQEQDHQVRDQLLSMLD